ncbi:MAG: Asp23/Gls24 family envelope stress response protein [Clostridiales bacterium]|jgi:uncharacterized alkaline shock family protein YloU|nr:Asp23/Gls24 family envelope stress response protein [Clostridiales bacterium]
MADSYITTVTEKGSIKISEDVIAVMVGAAVAEVDGVGGLTNTVGNEILDLIGKRTLSKGIKVTLEDESITVDVLIMVSFGGVVTEIAKNVQKAVTSALEAMTGLTPEVNVHVSGVSFPKTRQ